MDLMPTTCPKCGDQMSTPLISRRKKLLMSTCRSCGYTAKGTSPVIVDGFTPVVPASDHAQMFRPNTARPEPPKPRMTGALERFEKTWMQGTFNRELAKTRKTAAAASVIDPKLKQLPGGDR